MKKPPPLAVVVVLVVTGAPPLAVPVVVPPPLPVDVLVVEVNWRVGMALQASTEAKAVDVKMSKGK
jgi:hypothetical protein